MKRKIIFGLCIISTTLLLLDILTNLEISNSYFYSVLLFVSLSTLIIIIGGHFAKRTDKLFQILTLTIVAILCLSSRLLIMHGDWKTQTILYTHGHFPRFTIEFQMQDIGTLGYNRRTVERIKILPGIDIITKVDENKIFSIPWFKADIDVNELGLKGG